MKRGQVTVYIIVGLLALTAIILTLYTQREYLNSILKEREARITEIPAEIQPVEDYMDNCLKEASPDILNFILLQGGYAEPEEYIEFGDINIPYWYNNGDKSPSLEFIENQIENYISSFAVPSCIGEYTGDGEINLEKTDVQVNIKQTNTLFSIKPILNVNINNLTHVLDRTYNIDINSDAYDLFGYSKKIVESEVTNPDSIDFSLLSSSEYNVEMMNAENNEIIYSVSSGNHTIMFANKF